MALFVTDDVQRVERVPNREQHVNTVTVKS